MMTTNLFVIVNVKQLRTGGSFRILLPFPEHLGVLASQIQRFLTVFTIGLSLARFWRAFGISGGRGVELPQPPRYATAVHTDFTYYFNLPKHKHTLSIIQYIFK